MTLLTSIANEVQFAIESNEARIRRLRTEAVDRLEATTSGETDLVAVFRLIFDILSVQDRIDRDRHRISSVTK